MEWVEITGKTIEEAKERAFEQLGVAESDAEVQVIEEPKAGLFGRVRGEARVRARLRPVEPRPKRSRNNNRPKARGEGQRQGRGQKSGGESKGQENRRGSG